MAGASNATGAAARGRPQQVVRFLRSRRELGVAKAISAGETVAIPDGKFLHSDVDALRRALSATGFCRLRGQPPTTHSLHAVAAMLGEIQGHVRASETGLIGDHEAPVRQDWTPYRAEYVSLGAQGLEPHTDGAYIDGLLATDTGLQRFGPPRFIVQQCLKHAPGGGETILVDTQQIFAELLEHDPEILATLLTPGCIVLCRDDLLCTELPVFERRGDDWLRMRFRFDSHLYVPAWAEAAISAFRERIHAAIGKNPLFTLKPGDLLIVDNERMLHGRTGFSRVGERRLRKVWIFDDTGERVHRLVGDPRSHRALRPFEAYAPTSFDAPAVATRGRCDSGIRIDHEQSAALNKLEKRFCIRSKRTAGTRPVPA
ncbi:MAG: TauD/TfdA family dioxygenase [Pseudomonadota bacterium]